MENIEIKISNKIAICKKKYLIPENAEYRITFDFDSDWDKEAEKIVRFTFDGTVLDIPFTGKTARIPTIFPCSSLGVSVFSPNISSTAADIGCVVLTDDLEAWNFDGCVRGECE